MKKAFLLTIMVALISASQSFALYNLMDQFAAEVLLNKPDIISNLDFVKGANNVAVQKDSATYRSSFDSHIAVILENVNHGDELNGLSVRLQMPVKEDVTPHVQSVVKFGNVKIDDFGQAFLESLGYDVEIYEKSNIDDVPCEEPIMDRPDEPMPVEGNPTPDTDVVVGDPLPHDDTSVVVVNPDAPVLEPPVVIMPSPFQIQSAFLSKGNIGWSISQYESADESSVDFVLNIMDAESISDEVREDFQKMLTFYGLEYGERDQLGDNMRVMKYVDLVPDVDEDEFNFQPAMKAELEWLKANGVVMGLTEQDIDMISSASKPGLSGWNSRIAYSDGEWVPYYETDDAKLIFILEDEAIAPEAIDVPDGAVDLIATSVSPMGKSITKWGKIKNNLGQ